MTSRADGNGEYYSFSGNAGDVMNLSVMSASLQRIGDPIAAVLSLYNANGKLLAISTEDLETSDPIIYDFKLPTDGTYYVEVSSATPSTLSMPRRPAVMNGSHTASPTALRWAAATP